MKATWLFAALLLPGLAGCQTAIEPASVAGECNVFRDPGFPVQGKRPKDQRWISKSQEQGIRICGWSRPEAEPPEPVVTVAPAPTT